MGVQVCAQLGQVCLQCTAAAVSVQGEARLRPSKPLMVNPPEHGQRTSKATPRRLADPPANPAHLGEQAGLVRFHAFRQSLLDVNRAADAVLRRTQRQLHLRVYACMPARPSSPGQKA
eukprot:355211-Chlamydomonas_euryale.AAC.7